MDVRGAWGKLGRGVVPHPLICHVLDTAVVAEGLVGVLVGPHCRAELEAGFGPLGDAAGWVSVLCGLHDLGKLSPAFQGLRQDVAVPALGPVAGADVGRLAQWRDPGARTDCHHGLLTAVHLVRLLRSWGAVPATARSVAWALGGHHGVVPSAAAVQQAREAVGDNGGPRWAAACDELVGRVVSLWGLPQPGELPWQEVRFSPEAVVALAGLASVSDWIASARPETSYAGLDVDLAAYLAQARVDEARKIEKLAWRPWRPPRQTGFAALFPDEEQPRPVQVAVEAAVAGMRGAGIVVVAAPTGEGKTKAALQAVAEMVRRLGLQGFYAAMPSRVTSNQAFETVEELLEEADVPVRLLHSTAGEYLKGRAAALDPAAALRPVGVDVDGEGDGDGQAAQWFAHKRGLLAPVGVGTVDQALMAALRSSHVFVRLTGLSGKVVVFDEVHGYDVHMSTLMDRLLWWLGRMRVPVVVLSATLPSGRQHALVESWRAGAQGRRPGTQAVAAAPGAFPRVVWADERCDAVQVVDVPASELNSGRVVELSRVAFAERARWALRQAGEGRCVAVVQNLVRHAEEAYEQILQLVEALPQAERPEVFLLHGQLEEARRARVEAEILARFGPPDPGREQVRPKRAIVVGTKLLEEGLDVDFDVMISSLAPIDSLIQRMGRIQRHQRDGDRPGLLLALTGVEEEAQRVAFPRYTTNVHAEAVLLRTWAVLRGRTQVRCPDEVQQLVDLVYGPQEAVGCPRGWERQWERAAAQLQRSIAGREEKAEGVRLPQPRDDVQLWELTARATRANRTRQDSYRRDGDWQ
ncbi:CRISPR-associated helicase Cas3' [Streptomyces sp. GbtcB6]|uniref:CRISPR-associated helicase Cas3' n=1 Tax=Streptomyces sp. GbtcB6 TaxID=2824751 RepID=UPI0027E48136|nr:CRISPR-associated helicase Cas3' [Streptomyces sp. GbtcB6]